MTHPARAWDSRFWDALDVFSGDSNGVCKVRAEEGNRIPRDTEGGDMPIEPAVSREQLLSESRKKFRTGDELAGWALLCEWAFRGHVQTGKTSRTKGQSGERELFGLLSDELGFVVQRNIGQTRAGGSDTIELPGFAPEVKRCETLCLPKWWRQAVKQGESLQAEPIVFFRQSRKPWQAMLHTMDGGYEVVSWEAAMLHVREKLARLYGIHREAA